MMNMSLSERVVCRRLLTAGKPWGKPSVFIQARIFEFGSFSAVMRKLNLEKMG